MGNFCSSDDKELIQFSKFYKSNKDFIVTEFDLANKVETPNKQMIERFFNKSREKILEKMGKEFLVTNIIFKF